MGKKKGRRESRKERKAAEKERQAAIDAELAERAKRRRSVLIAIPVLTLAAVLVCWLVLEDTRLVGVTTLIGGLLFLMVALAGLGGAVKPRDRLRSGAIDFGGKE
ncbi:MAG: hypothetical protein AAGE52_24820 [Myxococcota bacterium]